MIQLEAIFLQGQGKRSNQEDSFFPEKKESNSRVFIVCDGVGGAEKGEVASQLAAQTIGRFLGESPEKPVDEALVQEAVVAAEKELAAFQHKNPEAAGIGTTLTLLHLGDDEGMAAHIGDSRIYHFCQNDILWKTRDHSWVEGMLQSELLTPEQAAEHPRRNVITRALQGNLAKEIKADVHPLFDVQKGDAFLLCSDGVLGSFTDERLCEIMTGDNALSEKAKTLESICSQDSKDNFTAWLIRVTDGGTLRVYKSEPVSKTTVWADALNRQKNRIMEKQGKPLTIGRSPDNNVKVQNPTVSGRHCTIEQIAANSFLLIDADSTNGTRVNDWRIKRKIVNRDDKITLGSFTLHLEKLYPHLKPPAPLGPAPQKDFSAEFGALKEVWDNYQQAKIQIFNNDMAKRLIGAGLSLIPYFGHAIGMVLTASISSEEKLQALRNEFMISYLCPKCYAYLEEVPHEALAKKGTCGYCKVKWENDK